MCVHALFVGYQSTGKTTFLTASVAASSKGRLKDVENKSISFVDQSDPISKESFFRGGTPSKIENFLKGIDGQQVTKTKMNDFHEFFFDCSIDGNPFPCQLVDYAGELADFSRIQDKSSTLKNKIEKADCLYLFIDASLSNTDVRFDIGQNNAIVEALKIFREQALLFKPVVVVVNKSDQLFKNSNQLEKEINDLNKNQDKAKDQLLKHFEHLGGLIFEQIGKKLVNVLYVATLGSHPIKSEFGYYYIESAQKWSPIGLGEALKQGIVKAYHRKYASNLFDVMNKLSKKVYTWVILGLIMIYFIISTMDTYAIDGLQKSIKEFSFDKNEISDLEKQYNNLNSLFHPTIDRVQLEQSFKDINNIKYKKITDQITKNSLEKQIIKLIDFKTIKDQYTKRIEDLKNISNQITNVNKTIKSSGFKANRFLQELHISSKNEGVVFLERIGQTLFQETKNIIEIKTIFDHEYTVQESSFKEDLDNQRINESEYLELTKKLDQVKNNFQSLFCEKTDFLLTQLEPSNRIEGLLLSCNEKTCTNYEKYCDILKNDIAAWEEVEANKVLANYPIDIYDISLGKYEILKTYHDNSKKRQLIYSKLEIRYSDEVSSFLSFVNSLDRTYFVSLNLKVTPNTSSTFLQTETICVESGGSWCSPVEKTCDTKVIPPNLKIMIYVNQSLVDEAYANDTFDYKSRNIAMNWKPNDVIRIDVYNQKNNQRETIASSSFMSLFYIQKNDRISGDVQLKFDMDTIPKLTPSKLDNKRR